MPRDKTVRYVTTKLSDAAHNALLMRASELGIHITDLATRYVEAGLVDDNQGNTLQVRLFKAAWAARQKDLIRAQLEHIAFTAMRDTDEEMMERLKQLCEEAQVPLDEVMYTASRFSEPPDSSNTKMAEAMTFIASMLREGPIRATVAMDASQDRGFSRWMVDQAKRKLNVESFRESDGWWWKLEPGEERRVQ